MLLNSLPFLLFFIVVFFAYWFLGKRSATHQNIVLLLAGVFFYGFADLKFLGLMGGYAIGNFLLGRKIASSAKELERRVWFWAGILVNIGILCWFKYFDFFYSSFVGILNLTGADLHAGSLHLLLPLGISFITFQMLGYLIDVHNDEIQPTKDLLGFTAYVFYFPKLLAGPIERAQNFLPQIEVKRTFDYSLAVDGVRQVLWGLFTKVVIADRCAVVADSIFADYSAQNSNVLMLGAFLYAIQVYADFSGYSNMAIGVSKLLNIRLMQNFAFPYFSTNIADYWRRWHISLSTWMMDYVYTPLSFYLRGLGKGGTALSIVLTFVLVGLWHGANWTFVVFGLLHGLCFLPLVLRGVRLDTEGVMNGSGQAQRLNTFLKMLGMFSLAVVFSVFFRAPSVSYGIGFIKQMLFEFNFGSFGLFPKVTIGFVLLFLAAEWIGRKEEHALSFSSKSVPAFARISVYYAIVFLVVYFNKGEQDFIYVQF